MESHPKTNPSERIGRVRSCVASLAVLALAGSFAAAPATAGSEGAIEVSLPPPTGADPVGTRPVELVDRSRRMGFGIPGPRRLMVQLTYPTTADSHCAAAPYAPRGILKRLGSELDLDRPLDVDTGLCAGGEIEGGKRPLLLLSHAYMADRHLYTSLAGDLASRGFVVASIDHTGEAFAVRFPDRGYVDGVYGGVFTGRDTATFEETQRLVDVRADDTRFVLSKLRGLSSRGRGPLAGRISPEAGVLGHSLGGATATQESVTDARFGAAANLDGEIWGGPATAASAEIPYLMAMAGDAPVWTAFRFLNVCDFYSGLQEPRYAWLLPDALHFSFSDFQVLAPEIARQDPDWSFAGSYQSVIGTVDPVTSVDSQRRALSRFFSTSLKPGSANTVSPPGNFTEATPAGLDCF